MLFQIIGQYKDKPELADDEKSLLIPFIKIINNPKLCESKRNFALQALSSWMVGLLEKSLYGCRKIDEGYVFLRSQFKDLKETKQLSTFKVIMDLCSVSSTNNLTPSSALGN
ncbi:TPA: hypothetical protein JBA38_11930 [Legionella pneumophila]|uniref:hypothetical protein n=1 Tax=Legionella pneumophila TaxID=446 RepID=UPI000770866A|nr:hypothetical protein [Legionella pneumophila]TIG82549.1 hypothetical protein DI110_14825 [Legionella pneumophila]CZH54564.1 Uncharacterised protein [Legionella pneumophila]STX84114.1 Uncharacterised protein [Legionella pneumophila]HAT2147249.1 hypothetical protein [Legionella pneumophila]HAT2150353.1 hypothetical protein [Legionella pneumophila]